MDMCLHKFDNYQGRVAPNCFKSHTDSCCPDFVQKNVLSDVRSEIYINRGKTVSNGQSVRVKRKNIFRPAIIVT